MTAGRKSSPPRLASRLVSLALPSDVRGESIRGDLEEEFHHVCAVRSPARARAWYRRQALRVIVGYRLAGLFDPSRNALPSERPPVGLAAALTAVREDVRFAVRRFVRAPTVTLVAVVTIAIGVGANTAMFSVLDTVLLADVPYPDADRIVQVWQTNPDYQLERGIRYGDFTMNARDYVEYESETRVFDAMGYALRYENGSGVLDAGDGGSERVVTWGVSPRFFDVLGMPPVLGRSFAADETAPQGEMRWTPVVILSHDLWMSRFDGDPGVLGREIRFESAPATVVGVLPEGFEFPSTTFQGAVESWDVDLYVPLFYQALYQPQEPNRMRQFRVIGRLRDGVSPEEANTDLARVASGLEAAHPETHAGWRPVVMSLLELRGFGFRTSVLTLMGVVAFVLLIACANVANLLLAQGAARRSEMAVRSAIGGGRGHLVQMLLTESVLLASAGGAVGVGLAVWGTRRLVRILPSNVPGVEQASVDGRALLFALGLTLLTGVVFGLLPALRTSALRLASDLGGGRGESGVRGEWRASRVLVAAQVALTVILLVAGGVLGKSFYELRSQPLGYEPENALVVSLVRGAHHALRVIRPNDAEQRQSAWRMTYDLLERMQAIPGVTSASTGRPPQQPRGGYFPVQFTEEGDGPEDNVHSTGLNWVSPDYFEAMGIPLLRGEGLPEWDGVNDWERYWWATECNDRIRPYCKALVSETFAEQVWPGEDPIGKELGIYGCCWTVAGVVGDVRHKPLDQWWSTRDRFNPDMQVYVNGEDDLILRTSVDPLSITGAVREAAREIDPEAVVEFDTLEQLAYDSLVRPRFFFLVFALFAGVALLMSLVGLYGVIAFSVGRRTREIGVRMALGAARLNVRTMVVRQGMAPVFFGLAVGLTLATMMVDVLEGFLYQTPPLDPWVMAGVGALLALVSAMACWAPARHASAVDPVRALAYE